MVFLLRGIFLSCLSISVFGTDTSQWSTEPEIKKEKHRQIAVLLSFGGREGFEHLVQLIAQQMSFISKHQQKLRKQIRIYNLDPTLTDIEVWNGATRENIYPSDLIPYPKDEFEKRIGEIKCVIGQASRYRHPGTLHRLVFTSLEHFSKEIKYHSHSMKEFDSIHKSLIAVKSILEMLKVESDWMYLADEVKQNEIREQLLHCEREIRKYEIMFNHNWNGLLELNEWKRFLSPFIFIHIAVFAVPCVSSMANSAQFVLRWLAVTWYFLIVYGFFSLFFALISSKRL